MRRSIHLGLLLLGQAAAKAIPFETCRGFNTDTVRSPALARVMPWHAWPLPCQRNQTLKWPQA